MDKIDVRRGPGTECNGLCNVFDRLHVFAQSFALGAAAMCTLLAPPGPSELTLEVKQEHENTADNRDSTERESETRASTRSNPLQTVDCLSSNKDAASNLQEVHNEQIDPPKIKSCAKRTSSSQTPLHRVRIAPSRTPQSHSVDLPNCLSTPDTVSGKHPSLRSVNKRPSKSSSAHLSEKKNRRRAADFSGKKSSPNHREDRALTEPSSSANTLHNDLKLVLPSFDSDSDSGTAANSGDADSAQCTAKAADRNCTEQCHVRIVFLLVL